jgi:hypothetical protein
MLATVTTRIDDVDGVYRFADAGWFLPSDSNLFETYDTQ